MTKCFRENPCSQDNVLTEALVAIKTGLNLFSSTDSYLKKRPKSRGPPSGMKNMLIHSHSNHITRLIARIFYYCDGPTIDHKKHRRLCDNTPQQHDEYEQKTDQTQQQLLMDIRSLPPSLIGRETEDGSVCVLCAFLENEHKRSLRRQPCGTRSEAAIICILQFLPLCPLRGTQR